jgi:hypothetical protein
VVSALEPGVYRFFVETALKMTMATKGTGAATGLKRYSVLHSVLHVNQW